MRGPELLTQSPHAQHEWHSEAASRQSRRQTVGLRGPCCSKGSREEKRSHLTFNQRITWNSSTVDLGYLGGRRTRNGWMRSVSQASLLLCLATLALFRSLLVQMTSEAFFHRVATPTQKRHFLPLWRPKRQKSDETRKNWPLLTFVVDPTARLGHPGGRCTRCHGTRDSSHRRA